MRGNRPLAFGGVLGSCLVGFCLVLGLLVFFSPSSCCVSFPFKDDLGTPPTRRPHSWKKSGLPSGRSFVLELRRAPLGFHTEPFGLSVPQPSPWTQLSTPFLVSVDSSDSVSGPWIVFFFARLEALCVPKGTSHLN